jgi:4'-phosphopantetheinyl transferase
MANIKEPIIKKTKNFPILSPGEIHVWQVSMNISALEVEECKDLLSDTELEKMHFFNTKQSKDSFVVSQGVLRILLSSYLGISPKLATFGRRGKGKPFSLDDPGLHFNLSNSGKLAVIAFSRDSELGIDIEQIRTLPDLDEMIETNFTSNEIRFINARPEERLQRFFRFWTVKESYLKAIGEGMRLEPKNIEFSIDNEYIRLLSVKGVFEQEDWNFKEFTISTDYVGTITYGKENIRIKQMMFN